VVVGDGSRRVRVLIVDDSALMRQMIRRTLDEAGLEVVGTARDGLEAIERVAELRPDVVTLDIEMPRLDGLGALERLMAERPVPVVMCSSLTEAGAGATMRALELGAVDFVQKPGPGVAFEEIAGELGRKVLAAASARVRPAMARHVAGPDSTPGAAPSGRADGRRDGGVGRGPGTVLGAPKARSPGQVVPGRPAGSAAVGPAVSAGRGRGVVAGRARLIVIASSTGGPNALFQTISELPGDLSAAVVIVQHMPAGFTRSLAQRLDERSALRVREAAAGDMPEPGLVLVAPGDRHLELDEAGRVRITEAAREHGVRPAADVTLRSAVKRFSGALDLVVLTGMGSDGTAGARYVKAVGGRVVVEAESTAVVWGMPRAVAEAGLADAIVPLGEIPGWIVALAAGARRPVG
jgi:two-component system chemotaxis response regulator CheB